MERKIKNTSSGLTQHHNYYGQLRFSNKHAPQKLKRASWLSHNGAGFTILDSVLALFVIGTMILLFGSLITARDANRRTLIRAQAAALADEQVSALKRLGFTNLTNQTNGAFRSIIYNAGPWKIVGGGFTGNALELPRNSSITNAVSGRWLFPAGSYATATLEAKWKIASDSPSGWAVGYIFRGVGPNNHYRVRLAATTTDLDGNSGNGIQNLVIEKIASGVVSVLASKSSAPISLDTWTTLRLVMDDTANPRFMFYIDGNQQNVASLTDATFASGPAALLAWGGAHVFVDDVQTTTTSTTTWDFNSSTEMPAAWIRLGLNDLPDATPNTFDDNGKLTIAPYPNSNSQNLKQATVRVEWLHRGNTQHYTSTVLVGKSEIGL